jgi:hypothetical protein
MKLTPQQVRDQHRHARTFSEKLREVPWQEWPIADRFPMKIYRSRKYMVQVWDEKPHIRLSICRSKVKPDGTGWQEVDSWDEIQQIKSEIGYGHCYAIEVYPADRDVVNVANFRHIWVLDKPLDIGWFKK